MLAEKKSTIQPNGWSYFLFLHNLVARQFVACSAIGGLRVPYSLPRYLFCILVQEPAFSSPPSFRPTDVTTPPLLPNPTPCDAHNDRNDEIAF